jgi:hypothetical protein
MTRERVLTLNQNGCVAKLPDMFLWMVDKRICHKLRRRPDKGEEPPIFEVAEFRSL